MHGYVYILTNKPHGSLYIGVTSDLVKRVYQHREGFVEGFTRKYHLKKLVYYEMHEAMDSALQRERTMKHWLRQWKVDLIETCNPEWRDLYDEILGSSPRMTNNKKPEDAE